MMKITRYRDWTIEARLSDDGAGWLASITPDHGCARSVVGKYESEGAAIDAGIASVDIQVDRPKRLTTVRETNRSPLWERMAAMRRKELDEQKKEEKRK